MNGNNNHLEYLMLMKDILHIEKVNQLSIDNEKELKNRIKMNY